MPAALPAAVRLAGCRGSGAICMCRCCAMCHAHAHCFLWRVYIVRALLALVPLCVAARQQLVQQPRQSLSHSSFLVLGALLRPATLRKSIYRERRLPKEPAGRQRSKCQQSSREQSEKRGPFEDTTVPGGCKRNPRASEKASEEGGFSLHHSGRAFPETALNKKQRQRARWLHNHGEIVQVLRRRKLPSKREQCKNIYLIVCTLYLNKYIYDWLVDSPHIIDQTKVLMYNKLTI